MEKEDEIQALRRELEQLRAQLDGQRVDHGGSVGGSTSQGDGVARQDSPVKPLDGSFRAAKPQQSPSSRDPSPRHNSAGSGAATAAGTKGVSFYEERGRSQNRSLESEYVSHVPVDTKRGKWWLKDRQVLSRNVPAPDAEIMAVKVRETWLWSGRTVIVDKIVTVPTSRLHNEHDVDYRPVGDTEERRSPEFESPRTAQRPQRSSSIASEVYADSKQLAKEFMLPSPSKSGSDDGGSGLTASARMEMEMARAMDSSSKSNDVRVHASPQRVSDLPPGSSS